MFWILVFLFVGGFFGGGPVTLSSSGLLWRWSCNALFLGASLEVFLYCVLLGFFFTPGFVVFVYVV